MDDGRRESLLKEYGEVCGNFRLLTDIRFKLLALLPIAAAAASTLRGDAPNAASFALSLFGLAATTGLIVYNIRNDQIYDQLVARAATIERSLGLPDGGFANRPRAWRTVKILRKEHTINHGTGVYVIYFASIVLWLTGVLAPTIEYFRTTYVGLGLPYVTVREPQQGVNTAALLASVLIAGVFAEKFRRRKENLDQELRKAASEAVRLAKNRELYDLRANDSFLSFCEELSGESRTEVVARLDYYNRIDSDSAGYYFLTAVRGEARAAQVVALLTDLPPAWLFDCATNRSGTRLNR
ncbi:hypothetical protein PHK61_31570 [Actinomycetospora lutea]|uniref:hypothetical protein n=1 Tax=Actinomycetospora lutea TaxID=663604 RepID=UPI002366252B|nr:hypothetical protein [Actinomycetospora lutea]MDD7942955.1 hypothetical protein [Actinomycetospora lutea]